MAEGPMEERTVRLQARAEVTSSRTQRGIRAPEVDGGTRGEYGTAARRQERRSQAWAHQPEQEVRSIRYRQRSGCTGGCGSPASPSEVPSLDRRRRGLQFQWWFLRLLMVSIEPARRKRWRVERGQVSIRGIVTGRSRGM
ncbi:Hypothetical predicted protein [Pelobates cultripes]|uniref:Uncharacterized protein n=1 Tax=Pelobates cultripes TaxID=61616 RepID=A0AAD1S4E3_PELCU|nr:Hypothetical predicted protein [Pelobates cultripes]